jgi:hypothetical protein
MCGEVARKDLLEWDPGRCLNPIRVEKVPEKLSPLH